MKKICLVLLISLLFVGCTNNKTTKEFVALDYAEAFMNQDEEALKDYAYSEEMEKALASLDFKSLFAQCALFGELEEIKEPSVVESGDYLVYYIPLDMTITDFDLLITIDKDDKIAGIAFGAYSGVDSNLNYELEEVFFGDEYGISATFLKPEGEGPFKTVILLAGSGASDRDESIGLNKPLKDIAEGLALKGIASLRYDKRSYLYPEDFIDNIYFTVEDEVIDDALMAYEYLKEREDVSEIYYLGHSLGGQLLPRIAKELKDDVSGYIFMAAPASDFLSLLNKQLSFLEDLEINQDEQSQLSIAALKEETLKLQDLDSLEDDELVLGAYKAYWEDLLAYDQLAGAQDMTSSMFFMQGEEDYQVTSEELALWQEALGNKAQYKKYPGLNHLFMEGNKEDGPMSYVEAKHVDQGVIDDIAAFIYD